MESELTISQKVLVLKMLKVPHPPKPSRSGIATSVNPMPTEKDLERALSEWEATIHRLHRIQG